MPTEGPHYFHPSWIQPCGETVYADICVYGGTAAGLVAALTAVRRGRSAVLLNPGRHLGGMTTGGLGWTDHGKRDAIGGMARDFYRAVGKHYGREEEWHFEPHVAQAVFRRWIADAGLDVRHGAYLDRVETEKGRIAALSCLGGLRVRADMFIDATYEGDLMAGAGVRHTVGRESNDAYGETLNGRQCRRTHQFDCPVDPHFREGDAKSGLLPHVHDNEGFMPGTADRRIQAYCFRVCMTDDPALRVPFPKPAAFDPREHILLKRWLRRTKDDVFTKFDRLANRSKTDTNNHGAVSTDYIGANWAYPNSDYSAREAIFQSHLAYQQGYHWTMAFDPEVPARIREPYAEWGLARDEFNDTGHWPPQLYVREARRMVSSYVVTESDCLGAQVAADPVGLASYQMDSHNCCRIVRDGCVCNEGDVQVKPHGPYGVSYHAIIPARGDCGNLVVPVCLSASHIAYGSIRMEPVFMILAESGAIAADLALANKGHVQDLPYAELRAELLAAQQVLDTPASLA